MRRCLDLVFADSLNPISDDGVRFTDRPGRVVAFSDATAVLASLPCDVLAAGLRKLLDERVARERQGAARAPRRDLASRILDAP